MVLYGYRYGEVPLARIGEIKPSAEISEPREVCLLRRPPIAVSLGVNVNNLALPHPDSFDPVTLEAGVRKRFLCEPPKATRGILDDLQSYVQKYVEKHYMPLSPHSDVSVETWLANTNYPEWRKVQLRETWCRNAKYFETEPKLWKDSVQLKKLFRCKSFMKDEHYVEYKHARAINSRSDPFKCAVGPIFKLIESEIYKDPAFIKHVPVSARPDYIMEMMYHEGGRYLATDYTAFESLFVKEVMRKVEFILYRHMTKLLPAGERFMVLCERVLAGTNSCDFKHFSTKCEATRMSGEMCTSLGNGFSNLMFMRFMCKRKGCTRIRGVVEGDDGLFTMCGTPPTTQDFASLGLNIKLEVHSSLTTASFCGLIFHPEERINVTDPVKTLASFGWTTARYAGTRKSRLDLLLRSKALSLAHQYPGCPIISELAQYGLRITQHIRDQEIERFVRNTSSLDTYHRSEMIKFVTEGIPTRETGLETRYLVEKLYGVRVDQQLALENYLKNLDCPMELDLSPFGIKVHEHWLHFFKFYSAHVRPDDPLRDYPPHNWTAMSDFSKEW